jgi:hypothetical protein
MQNPVATVTYLAAAFLLFGIGQCTAQEKKEAEKNPLDHPGCKSYFMIFWADSHIPGGVLAHWEKSQEKWYLGKGEKKYPKVCMDAKKATYLLVYTTEEHSFKVTEFEHVGGGSSSISGTTTTIDNSGGVSTGTVEGTIDVPSVSIPVERTVQRSTVYMYVYSTRGTPFLSGGKPGSTPLEVFVEKEHQHTTPLLGQTIFNGLSSPARDAFEDSIRFVSNMDGK